MSDFIASWLTPTSLFLLLNVVIGTIFLISQLSSPKTTHPQQFRHDGGGYNSAPPLRRAPSLIDRVKSVNFSNFKFSLPNQDFNDDHNIQQHVDSYLAPNPLDRAPSILERVKAINLSLHKYPPQNPDPVYVEQPVLSRPPSFLERVKSIDFKSYYRSDSGKLNPETVRPASEEPSSDIDTSPVHSQVVKRSKSEHDNVKQRKFQEKMKKSASEKFKEEDREEEEVERRRPATARIEKTTSIGDGDHGVDAKADDFINKFKQQLKLQRLDSLLRYRDMLKSNASN